MNSLVLALYAEGRTDERFLPIVIQRTAEQILAQRGSQVVDVPAPIVLDGSIDQEHSGRAERIVDAASLGLPQHAQRVESDADPKRTLNRAVQNALAGRPRRRRRLDVGTLYEPLARQISLARLRAVPSYARFAGDLTDLLLYLHMVV